MWFYTSIRQLIRYFHYLTAPYCFYTHFSTGLMVLPELAFITSCQGASPTGSSGMGLSANSASSSASVLSIGIRFTFAILRGALVWPESSSFKMESVSLEARPNLTVRLKVESIFQYTSSTTLLLLFVSTASISYISIIDVKAGLSRLPVGKGSKYFRNDKGFSGKSVSRPPLTSPILGNFHDKATRENRTEVTKPKDGLVQRKYEALCISLIFRVLQF